MWGGWGGRGAGVIHFLFIHIDVIYSLFIHNTGGKKGVGGHYLSMGGCRFSFLAVSCYPQPPVVNSNFKELMSKS